MSKIETHSLSAGYGKKIIIENAEIEIKSGEIVSLIGANGSGKSTILKTIAGQLEAVSGTVYIDGRDISKMSESKIAVKLSIMTTEKVRAELMTCKDVVESGRYPYTGRLGILSQRDRDIVRETFRLVDGAELVNQDFNRISDGQRQKIMLARAICQEPDILVLDEPTSYLDMKHKLELLKILRKLVREKNTAVIMSMHELDLALKISDRIICVKNNFIDRTGTPEEIFSDGYISELFGVDSLCYNEFFGTPELEKISGEPEIFVIGGMGKGIPVYRRLERMGVPFAVGVLHENDIDFPVAKALSCKVISEKAFEPVSAERVRQAEKVLQKCRKLICCVEKFGSMNSLNRELLEFAKQKEIEIEH